MLKSYKYKLLPNNIQEEQIQKLLVVVDLFIIKL